MNKKNEYCTPCENSISVEDSEMIRHTHCGNECHQCGNNITSAVPIFCAFCGKDILGFNPIRYIDNQPACPLCFGKIFPLLKADTTIDGWRRFSDELPDRETLTLIYDESSKSFSLKFDVMWDIAENFSEHKHIGTHWKYINRPTN